MNRSVALKLALFFAAWAALASGSSGAQDLVVQGQITDAASTPRPIRNIRVKILDATSTPGIDGITRATVYTDADGNYSATVPRDQITSSRVRLKVDWFFLLPPAYNGHHLHLRGRIPTTALTCANPHISVNPFELKVGPRVTVGASTSSVTLNVRMDQAQPVRTFGGTAHNVVAEVYDRVVEVLNYHTANKGNVRWNQDQPDFFYDISTVLRSGNHRSYVCAATPFPGITMFISELDVVGQPPNGFVSDLYHEIGHYVHGNMNTGSGFPYGSTSGSHTTHAETDVQTALTEGWASYVGELTDALRGVNGDNKHAPFRDQGSTSAPANGLWRGGAFGSDPGDAPTGYDLSNTRGCLPPPQGNAGFESGECVEGALSGAWFSLHAEPEFGFTSPLMHNFDDIFRVMVEDAMVTNFREFFLGFRRRRPEAMRPKVTEISQTHGIVYSRLLFDGPQGPFQDNGMDGRTKEIDGIRFLSREVKTFLRAAKKEELDTRSASAPGRPVRFRFKPANEDLDDPLSAFAANELMALADSTFIVSQFVLLDTGDIPDGDWELLVVGENGGFVDNLKPSWGPIPGGGAFPDLGDATEKVRSDERYLRLIGALYDKDQDPDTAIGTEGKVIVDNTAPEVRTLKPQ